MPTHELLGPIRYDFTTRATPDVARNFPPLPYLWTYYRCHDGTLGVATALKTSFCRHFITPHSELGAGLYVATFDDGSESPAIYLDDSRLLYSSPEEYWTRPKFITYYRPAVEVTENESGLNDALRLYNLCRAASGVES